MKRPHTPEDEGAASGPGGASGSESTGAAGDALWRLFRTVARLERAGRDDDAAVLLLVGQRLVDGPAAVVLADLAVELVDAGHQVRLVDAVRRLAQADLIVVRAVVSVDSKPALTLVLGGEVR